MSNAEMRLKELGLVLPAAMKVPPGVEFRFPWVRIHGKRAFVSGHCGLEADGGIARPTGKVGEAVSVEQAYEHARKTALSILSSLKLALGDLERIECWLRVLGMVNCDPSFQRHPAVIDGFSDLILDVFGSERGQHARSAVGMASLPFGIPVEIEAEIALK